MDRYVEDITKSLTTNMVYEKTFIHPEEYGNEKINNTFDKGFTDVSNIDIQLKELAIKTEDVLSRTIKRLDVVKDTINAEKERLQDISMLCNAKTDYDNVIPLKDNSFIGTYTYEDGVFYSGLNTSSSVKFAVDDITGNGYEGNKYVIKDNSYLEDVLSTKTRSALYDNNISSYWEYSRITASSSEPYLIADFNTDDAEAKSTVTLRFASVANEVVIKTTSQNIRVTGIRYSSDGVNYKDVAMLPFTINNKDDSYKNEGYVYGSNIISFPSSKYLKITFESIGYTNDVIAFERTETDSNESIQRITTIVPTAKRHAIKINDIYVRNKSFVSESTMKTNELITQDTDVYAISVFANVYYPTGLSTDSVKFILTVNGTDYEVKPVNSYDNGIKIIRFSQGKMPTEYTQYIGEKIQSAYLTVVMKTKNHLTPYMNNVKILLGGEI